MNYSDPAQLDRRLPRRVAYMKFTAYKPGSDTEIADTWQFDGLNIRFSVQKEMSTLGGGNTGDFGICNLSMDVMKHLANRFENVEFANRGYVRAELFAGYIHPATATAPEVAQIARIFDGSVLKTSVTMPPDVWFNFSGITNFGRYGKPLERTFAASNGKYIPFLDICKAVAEYCDLRLIYEVDTAFVPNIKKYCVSGSEQDAIRQLSVVAPLTIRVRLLNDKKILVVTDLSSASSVDEKLNTTWKINADTGLIGVPEFSSYGAKVRILLNPVISPLDSVELKIKSMPYWNGKYTVGRLRHAGELRGNEFYTELELWNTKETMPYNQ